MKTALKFTGISFLVAITLFACRKEKEVDNETNSAVDNNMAERLFNEVDNMVDAAASGYFGSTSFKSAYDTSYFGCATVIHDTTSSPRTLIIDYGTSNCSCGDGKTRRGRIVTTYTGKYRDVGTVITHTFDNYYVNNHKIEGTKTVTNQGLNGSGNTHFSIVVTGGKILKYDGGIITWESTRDREWIAGESTVLNFLDDEYKITGTASGTKSDGVSFTATIGIPLHVKLNCRWITAGSIAITPSGKATRTIDYGNGDCDNNATVTINTITRPINLWY